MFGVFSAILWEATSTPPQRDSLPSGSPMLELRLLGQFDLRLDNRPIDLPSRPAQSLLAYLALRPGTAYRRERLAGLLWPDATEANARRYLRQALWRIRKALRTAHARLPSSPTISPSRSMLPLVSNWMLLCWNARCQPTHLPTISCVASRFIAANCCPASTTNGYSPERERLQAIYERKLTLLLDRLVIEQRWPVGDRMGRTLDRIGQCAGTSVSRLDERSRSGWRSRKYVRCLSTLRRSVAPRTRR